MVEIKAWGKDAAVAIEEAFTEMERINSLLNTYDPGSEVAKINRSAGSAQVLVSTETMEALKRAVAYCDMTGGALDITIGPLLTLWGFGKDEAGLSGNEPGVRAIKKTKALVNYRALELDEWGQTARLKHKGMRIDVGSFAKGFVADKAIQVLKKRGIHHGLIIAGGTVCAIGNKPDGSHWQVGVQHPRKKDSLLTIISLKNCSISTSGDYETFYKKNGRRRTHIIDPRTGVPVPHLLSVSVIAPDGITSDALSTALFVLGAQKGIDLIQGMNHIEALIVTEGGTVTFSRDWPEKKIFY